MRFTVFRPNWVSQFYSTAQQKGQKYAAEKVKQPTALENI